MDKSHIHQHCHHNNDSIWDPNNKQDIQCGKAPTKVKCCCIFCATQGPSVAFDHDTKDKEQFWTLSKASKSKDRSGVVPISLWSFCPQHKGAHKGDCHEVIDASNFVQWFKAQPLPNLTEPSSQQWTMPSAIAPTPKMCRWCQNARKLTCFAGKGTSVADSDTVPILKKKVKDCILEHKADFQPVELLWAKLKGNIGRECNSSTTMAIPKQRLDEEFDKSRVK